MPMLTPEKFLKDSWEEESFPNQDIIIPDREFRIITSGSSGPGGQNVNKRETKTMLIWNIERSEVLSEEQKQKIISVFSQRLDKEGNLIIYSQETRSQEQNKQRVIEKLREIVNFALTPVKERIPSRPGQGAVEKRLRDKKEHSGKKRLRRQTGLDD